MENGLIIHYLSLECERFYLNDIEYIHCTEYVKCNRNWGFLAIEKVYRNTDNSKNYILIYEEETDEIGSGIQTVIKHYHETGTIIQNQNTNSITKYYDIEPYLEACSNQSLELIEYHNHEEKLFYMNHIEQQRYEIRSYQQGHTSKSITLYRSNIDPLSFLDSISLRNHGWW